VVTSAREEPADTLVIGFISLLTLSAFLTQFVFRALDDNRLTSWQWVFAETDLAGMSGLLVAGIVAAYVLSRVSLPERRAAGVLALSAFLAAAVFWREPEVIVDAARYFTQAKHLETYGIGYFIAEWGREVSAWTDLPLVPFLYGTIFGLGGERRVLSSSSRRSSFPGPSCSPTSWGKPCGTRPSVCTPGDCSSGCPTSSRRCRSCWWTSRRCFSSPSRCSA